MGRVVTRRAWRAARRFVVVYAAATLWLVPATSQAQQQAWLKDEVRLNMRTGPGVEFRIIGAIRTGDAVQILDRGDGWTKVRAEELEDGWIPAGYLQSEPPAMVLLANRETETVELRERTQVLEKESTELRATNTELAERDESQQREIAQLTRENLELHAGARWPEWIAGAGILSVGMLFGAILRSGSTRRAPRVRL